LEVINGLQHAFEKWVERCKKCIVCQGRYFEKETVTAPPQSSDSRIIERTAVHNNRALSGAYDLEPLEHWDRGFESRSGHGHVFALFPAVFCFALKDLANDCPHPITIHGILLNL
jgi:hypothetical protein